MLTERGDGVASIKQSRHYLRSDSVGTLVTPSVNGRPKGTLEDLVSRVQNEKIYNYVKNVMVTASHVIGDAVMKFFPPGRTAKLQKDILMFQQHQDESLCDAWTRFKDLLWKVPHQGLDLSLQVQIFYDHVNDTTQMAIDYAGGDATLEQELESMECRVESLMRNEVLLEYEVGFTFPKRPYQEELEARILKLIDDQEDQIRQ
ncbi:zinc finger, CCHC-type containing protein [Tanacetum coccineum]